MLAGYRRSGFIDDLPPYSILDEIQRAPEPFHDRATVDRKRTPGRFMLTGSANAAGSALSDSLAGRMEILRLHPLAQCELAGGSDFLDAVFGDGFPMAKVLRLQRTLADRSRRAATPGAGAASYRRRSRWCSAYLTTLAQRDVRDLARIASLDALPRLLSLTASQTARLLNVSDLASPFQLSRPTIRDYMTLLASVFLVDELPPWHTNRLSRLIKTPKLHIGDTGLACALLGVDAVGLWRPGCRAVAGDLVYQELRRQASWRRIPSASTTFATRMARRWTRC